MTHKKNFITITEIRLFTDEQAVEPEKYFKARYLIGANIGERIGQSTNTDMFGFMKEIIAAEFAGGLLEENKIKAMSYDEFAKSKYGIKFNAELEPSQTVAVKDLKRVVETLKKYEEQWQGIQNVTEAFQQMYLVADQDEERNQLTRLINRMFDKEECWDSLAQGQSNWSGTSWAAEHNLRATHAVGNWYVEGYIESVKLRLFKDHSGIGIYVANLDGVWADRYTHTFTPNNKEGLMKCLKDYCTAPKETE